MYITYTDKKGKKKNKIDESAAPVLYAKVIYSDKTKQIFSLFRIKGKQKVNRFNYLNQYCYVKMALIIEGIYMSKTITSLQLKPRESLLTIKESDEEQSEGEEGNESDTEKGSEDENIEDLIISDIKRGGSN